MAARSYRMAGRDRVWDGLTVVRHVGGTAIPTVEALREALTWLGEQRPDHRLFCRPDRARGRWVPVSDAERPAWIEQLAYAGPVDLAPADPQPEEWAALGPDEPQLQLILQPRSYAIRFNHLIGDYVYTSFVERELLSAALTGRTPEGLLTAGMQRPVLTAVRRTARAVGLPFVRALAGPVPVDAPEEDADRPVAVPAPEGPAALVHRMTLVQPDARARLKEWRTGAEASEAAALFALTVAALDDVGGPRVPVMVLMDARSTLPRGSFVEGNLLTTVTVPREEVASPAAFRRFSKEAYSSGRVVAEVARAATGQVVRALLRRPRVPLAVPPSAGPAGLTLTYVRSTPGPNDPLTYSGPPVFNGYTNGPGGDSTLAIWYFSARAALYVGGSTAPEHEGLLDALVKRITEAPVELLPTEDR